MKTRLRHAWQTLSSGYWFLPSAMSGGAVLAAVAMVSVDHTYVLAGGHAFWLYSGGVDGAKTLLSTVAGSVITVAGVVFSITIAALTQASAQFGPRLLRTFMRDKGNQVVLGTFVATFMYCLLVLRTIHDRVDAAPAFVPQASVAGAVLLAMACVAVLIFFIHHVSMSLQAPHIVSVVRSELVTAMDRLEDSERNGGSLEEVCGQLDEDQCLARMAVDSCASHAPADGYVLAVDYEALIRLAHDSDLLLQVDCRAGDYVIRGNRLLRAWPAERWSAALEVRVQAAFIMGAQPTQEQDLEYAIRQMVEVAVRALSPAINDPFTAINCIDCLGSVVCRAASARLPARRCYKDGTLRIVRTVSTFPGIVDVAFDQIRQYGRASVAVTIRLLETIEACAMQVTADDQRCTLLRHAEMVFRQSQRVDAIPDERDRGDVRVRFEAVRRTLAVVCPEPPLGDRESGPDQDRGGESSVHGNEPQAAPPRQTGVR